ncbi:class I adenylate-forming enzyme family protein [Candidatus Thiosymbion oneisti]|uniref:class I adenylate-forming enzyme family protein n=1 Tax=Candidatus Thiosymbion oneisti TaxID=589554 RepID=UPI000AE5740F|nr:fatty acid--CoA ligase family protein [Candidatus Thiosymbion oneisti]
MTYLYDLFRDQAQHFAQKTALISGDARYSYETLLRQADRWATYLFAGQQKRPRIALLTEDPFHSISLSLAIARLDGACVPTNPQLLPEQLLACWQATDVDRVIYEPAFERKIRACDRGDMEFLTTDEITGYEEEGDLDTVFPWSDQKDFLITLSSGSTGAPKPIMLSQEVKVARARQTWDLYQLTSDDVVLCASPYFHSLGQRLVYVPLLMGATLVHLSRFTPKKWLDLVEENRVSFVIGVSSHLYTLKDYLLDGSGRIDSLKIIVTSSAPIDVDFKGRLFRTVGCRFHEIYGATEVAIATDLAPEYAGEKYATVGFPCKGVGVRILDDAGNELSYNAIGEIAVKTPLSFEGYYGRSDLTRAAMKDGYFLTGDLGSLDEDGFLSYVSRKKDIIISGGINIYPGDIEKVLLGQPAIKEVAVIGVDDRLLGEVVVAVCVADREENVDNMERELRGVADRHLAPFQRPLKYFFVDNLPLTHSGKLSKQSLREKYNAMNEDWTLALRMMLRGE